MARTSRFQQGLVTKDGRLYDISASGGFEAVCLSLFQDRDKAGLYPKTAPLPPTKVPPLPHGADEWTQRVWDKLDAAFKLRVGAFREASKEWAVLIRARTGDENAASWLIRNQVDHPTEGYEVFNLLTLNEKGRPRKQLVPEPEEELPEGVVAA